MLDYIELLGITTLSFSDVQIDIGDQTVLLDPLKEGMDEEFIIEQIIDNFGRHLESQVKLEVLSKSDAYERISKFTEDIQNNKMFRVKILLKLRDALEVKFNENIYQTPTNDKLGKRY